MTTRLLLSTLLLAAAAGAADQPALAGKWQVAISIGGTDREQACEFMEKDKALSGNCATDSGTVPLTGKVEDKKVTWTYKSQYNGGPLTVTFRGTKESDRKISGAVIVEEMGFEGEFTAIPAK